MKSSKGNIYDTVRQVIFDSMKQDEDGLYFETLKCFFEKWNNEKKSLPSFEYFHYGCGKKLKGFHMIERHTNVLFAKMKCYC